MLNEISFAVVGLGRIGWRHADNIRKIAGLKLAGVCDNDVSVLQKAKDEFSVSVFDDYKELLKNTNASVIVLATPSHLHYEMAMRAIESGYSLLIEKPISETAQQAIEIKDAAESAGVFVTVNQTFRYRPDVIFVKRIIESGVLGEIYKFELSGTIELTERTDWQIWKKYNGGQLANWGVHLIDAVLYILNHHSVDVVYSKLWRIMDKGDAEDCLKVVLEFSDECVADVEIGKSHYSKPDWYICGSKGSLIGEFQSSPPMMFLKAKYRKDNDLVEESETVDFTIHSNQLGEHYKDLAYSLLNAKPLPVSIDSVIRTMQVLDKAREINAEICIG